MNEIIIKEKPSIKEMKQQLKDSANDIKKNKIFWRKEGTPSLNEIWNKGNVDWPTYYALRKRLNEERPCDPHQYRHMHIAYCLLRGRTYKQIENSVREGNKPSKALINKYLKMYGDMEFNENE